MNADVEKAVERVNEGEAVTATPHPDCDALVKLVDLDDWHTIRQALRDQEAEIARLTKMLADCFRMSGADPDGDDDRRLADYALRAVTDLRRDYDDVLDWQDRAEKAEALLRDAQAVIDDYLPDHPRDAAFDISTRITAHLGAEQ